MFISDLEVYRQVLRANASPSINRVRLNCGSDRNEITIVDVFAGPVIGLFNNDVRREAIFS